MSVGAAVFWTVAALFVVCVLVGQARLRREAALRAERGRQWVVTYRGGMYSTEVIVGRRNRHEQQIVAAIRADEPDHDDKVRAATVVAEERRAFFEAEDHAREAHQRALEPRKGRR